MHPQLLDDTFVHPEPGFFGRSVTALARCRPLVQWRRRLFSPLPFVALESDVRNVVYLNWTVDVSGVRALVPDGMELWESDGQTLLTVLTYQHGHLGPALSGPLRPLFGSPYQSNWRLYLRRGPSPTAGGAVLFVKNIMSSTPYVLGARLLSDVLPSHAARSFAHEFRDERYVTEIRGGTGSAPDLYCEAAPVEVPRLPPELRAFADGWEEAVRYVCCQDFAVVKLPHGAGWAESRIALPIDFDTVVPLEVFPESFHCPCLKPLVGDRRPFAFLLPRVKFKVLGERLL